MCFFFFFFFCDLDKKKTRKTSVCVWKGRLGKPGIEERSHGNEHGTNMAACFYVLEFFFVCFFYSLNLFCISGRGESRRERERLVGILEGWFFYGHGNGGLRALTDALTLLPSREKVFAYTLGSTTETFLPWQKRHRRIGIDNGIDWQRFRREPRPCRAPQCMF